MNRNLKGTEQKRVKKIDFGHETIKVLYEDEYLAVILKPSGMLSVPYPGSSGKTALYALEQIMRKNGTFSSKHRPFVVHRLDRDTSGVMMFALTQDSQKKIMDNWQTMVTERLYRAVAENPKDKAMYLADSGLIDDEIAYNAHNIGFVPKKDTKPVLSDSMKKSIVQQKKNKNEKHEMSIFERNLTIKNGNAEFKTITARTHYKVIERGKYHTLFELSLDTGRKNQIRAHLSSKGYPLAGDENYRAKTDPFMRLALHARTLTFVHPYTAKKMTFEIPEPEEWIKTVQENTGNVPAVWNNEKKAFKTKNQDFSEVKTLVHKKLTKMDYISRGKYRGK